jgi:hypothetical protein
MFEEEVGIFTDQIERPAAGRAVIDEGVAVGQVEEPLTQTAQFATQVRRCHPDDLKR